MLFNYIGIRRIFSFLKSFQRRRKSVKNDLRITPECFNELFVLVKEDIAKQIINMKDARTPKLELAAKTFDVHLFLVLFS